MKKVITLTVSGLFALAILGIAGFILTLVWKKKSVYPFNGPRVVMVTCDPSFKKAIKCRITSNDGKIEFDYVYGQVPVLKEPGNYFLSLNVQNGFLVEWAETKVEQGSTPFENEKDIRLNHSRKINLSRFKNVVNRICSVYLTYYGSGKWKLTAYDSNGDEVFPYTREELASKEQNNFIGKILGTVFIGLAAAYLVYLIISIGLQLSRCEDSDINIDIQHTSRWEGHEYQMDQILLFIKNELAELKNRNSDDAWYWEIKERVFSHLFSDRIDEHSDLNELDEEFKAYLRANEPFLVREIPAFQTADTAAIRELKNIIARKVRKFYRKE